MKTCLSQYIQNSHLVATLSKSHADTTMMDYLVHSRTMICFAIMKKQLRMRSNNFKTRAELTDKSHLQDNIENQVQ